MKTVHGLNSQDGINFAKKSAPTSQAAPDRKFEDVIKQFAVGAPSLRPLTPHDMIAPLKAPEKELQPLNPPQMPLQPLRESAFDPGHPKDEKSEHERIMETARKWIAQTFYGTMLKQMRNSPFKSPIFSGGRGGEAFSEMLDQRLAEHMTRGSDSGLVRAITRKLEGKSLNQKKMPPAKAPAGETENPNQNVRMHVAPGLRA